jgi:ABC-type transport system involved in multi-copper enzyme maturation permease subunit
MNPRAVGLIARTVLVEAVRRREMYMIVLTAGALIALVIGMDFFGLEGLNKFYREMSLQVMSAATALAVIVLSARQLPREFEQRTIYPLLAKPVSRLSFLAGKLVGVMLAAGFCFLMFMAVYVIGTLVSGGRVPWMLFGQYVYLQMLMMLILATLGFWLSMVLNLDAAITVGVLFYATASLLTNLTMTLYAFMEPAGQAVLKFLTYAIPQLTVFNLSGKTIHAEAWDPLSSAIVAQLTLYGLAFAALYFGFAALVFRRRAL